MGWKIGRLVEQWIGEWLLQDSWINQSTSPPVHRIGKFARERMRFAKHK